MNSLAQLQDMTGRVAVITGGAGHLGLAFAETFAELGARVLIVDLDEAACAARAADLTARFSVEARGLAADLAEPTSAARIVDAACQTLGGLDVLVNNAAFTGASGLTGYAVPFADQSFEAWDAALRVNLTAAFQLCQAAAPALGRSGRGAILNVGSIYGLVGPQMSLYEGTAMGNPAAYAASKGGLLQLTRYLATVLAPRVRVNAVSPGGISRGQPEAFRERYERLTPLARMGQEADIKGAAAFLCSDAAAYVTGQNIPVDGGWTAW